MGSVERTRTELSKAIEAQGSQLQSLHERLARRAQQAARINAAGLPVVGIGVALCGLPDHFLQHWYERPALLLLAAGTLAASVTMWRRGFGGPEACRRVSMARQQRPVPRSARRPFAANDQPMFALI